MYAGSWKISPTMSFPFYNYSKPMEILGASSTAIWLHRKLGHWLETGYLHIDPFLLFGDPAKRVVPDPLHLGGARD